MPRWPITTPTAPKLTPTSGRTRSSSPASGPKPARRRSPKSSGNVMPRTIRFHLDENVDPRIAAGLRLHGIDVTTTSEAGLLAASDLEQLDYIVREGRVIITQDTDFLRLASSGHA